MHLGFHHVAKMQWLVTRLSAAENGHELLIYIDLWLYTGRLSCACMMTSWYSCICMHASGIYLETFLISRKKLTSPGSYTATSHDDIVPWHPPNCTEKQLVQNYVSSQFQLFYQHELSWHALTDLHAYNYFRNTQFIVTVASYSCCFSMTEFMKLAIAI